MESYVVMRLAERILAVMIGGLTIYLGYRLFLSMPQTTDAEGRFKLPWNTSIVLSRVGPGIFFALFGSIVVGSSLYRSIQVGEIPAGKSANANGSRVSGFAGATQASANDARSDARDDARMLLQRDIAVLNNIPSQLNPRLESHNRSSVELAIHRIKLALMATVWDDWGDRGALKEWMESADLRAPSGINREAVEFYRYGMKENQ